jgi:hypothetical protein
MNGWEWSNGGMILTGENWSTGRKTLYSVGGRWMNEYGAMVEYYWQGKTLVLWENPCVFVLCPPSVPHKLSQDATRLSVLGCQRLTPVPCSKIEIFKGLLAFLCRLCYKNIVTLLCHQFNLHSVWFTLYRVIKTSLCTCIYTVIFRCIGTFWSPCINGYDAGCKHETQS